MKQSFKSLIYAFAVVMFCSGILFGLNAKADSADNLVKARVCGIALKSANQFVEKIKAYPIDIASTDNISQLTITALSKREITKAIAVEELKRASDRLKEDLAAIEKFDHQGTFAIMKMKDGCDNVVSPQDIRSDVDAQIDKQPIAIKALKEEIGKLVNVISAVSK